MSLSIYDYLRHTTPDDLDKLYASPWCALAVLEHLDDVGKQIVMRLLCIKGFVAFALLRQWLVPSEEHLARLKRVVETLCALRILGSPDVPDGDRVDGEGRAVVDAMDMNGRVDVPLQEALALSKVFRASLQLAMRGETETPWQTQTDALPRLRTSPSIDVIELHAAQQWNAILHFLVGSYDAPRPEPKVVELLVATHLMAPGHGSDELNAMIEGDTPAGGASAAVALTYDEIAAAGGGVLHVTRLGHEFLLKDTAVQLWTFVNEYLSTAGTRGMKVTEILAFLFELGFCQLGAGYALAALTKTQQRLLTDFQTFGLVFIPAGQLENLDPPPDQLPAPVDASGRPKRVELRRIFPTSLSLMLTRPSMRSSTATAASAASSPAVSALSSAVRDTGGAPSTAAAARLYDPSQPVPLPGAPMSSAPIGSLSAAMAGASNKLILVVEKNFKVYAYTSVNLHVSLLALFTKVEVCLPNLVVATITRRSVMTALEKGIRASQLHDFLARRVHPAVTGVPENVTDQLYLWERERERVSFKSAVWLFGFDSLDVFYAAREYLTGLNALAWASVETREIVFQKSALDAFKLWLASNAASGSHN